MLIEAFLNLNDRKKVGQMNIILTLLVFLPLTFASESDGSSLSLWLFSTYIKGKTQFPEFSCTTTLDDITVGYYNSEIYIPRGNTTNEDDVIQSDIIKQISDYKYYSFLRRSALLRQDSQNGFDVYQTLVVCELLDFNTSGKMLIKDAARGYTTDEMYYFNNVFIYNLIANISQEIVKPHLEDFKKECERFFYPVCIDTLKHYLKKREKEINRKVEPQVRLFQKARSDSGGFALSCLVTGFYPRHINLTLLRDGQPVSDHDVTGGDLLPNGDGTYQMRKSLEIRAEEREKHKYTCYATHLGKEWHADFVDPPKDHIGLCIGVSVVFLVAICMISTIVCRKRHQTAEQRARAGQISVL